jgi:hypothetical protein
VTRPRNAAALVVAGVAAALLGACGGDDASQALPEVEVPPWDFEIQYGIDNAESEFVQAILADRVITAAEMQEAWDRTNQCIQDGDVPGSYNADG